MTKEMAPSRFETPGPTKRQERFMRMAGFLLGVEKGQSAEAVMEKLATDVGGYERATNALEGYSFGNDAEREARFKHDDYETVEASYGRDETTSNHVSKEVPTSLDFHDKAGNTLLSGATKATIDGRRSTGHLAGTVRGKIATKLVQKGTS